MLRSLPEALKKTNTAYTMFTNNETYPGVPLSYFHFCSTDDSNILCSHYLLQIFSLLPSGIFLELLESSQKVPWSVSGEKENGAIAWKMWHFS